MKSQISIFAVTSALICALCVAQPQRTPPAADAEQKRAEDLAVFIKANYTKYEYQIPMRDGVRLFTAVYQPKDSGEKWPIMMTRTPYSVSPYGSNNYRTTLGPSEKFARDKFIFVYQDVRGRYLSEGVFVDVRPYIANKKGPKDVDESSDTYDTVEWLDKERTESQWARRDFRDFVSGILCGRGMRGRPSCIEGMFPAGPGNRLVERRRLSPQWRAVSAARLQLPQFLWPTPPGPHST
jgi:hypothetical protein